MIKRERLRAIRPAGASTVRRSPSGVHVPDADHSARGLGDAMLDSRR